MDVAAVLAEAQVLRVAIVDDDLSDRISSEDLEAADPQVAALLNDETDPDRVAYIALLVQEGRDPLTVDDLAEPLSETAIRAAAPERIRIAAETVFAARRDRAESVRRVIDLLQALGIAPAAIDTYSAPSIPHDAFYDLIVVDYFLVDTATDRTLPFIQEVIQAHQDQGRPLQVILMSSHGDQLKADFRTIRPALEVSSSRLRIMEKPGSNMHLIGWRAALFQLASDRASVLNLERFIREAGTTLTQAAKATATKLWELDLQAMDLLHELASKDRDDYVRYVEDAVSRRLLSGLEMDGGMRPALQLLDATFTPNRNTNVLSPTAEIGDSRAAIHGLMHSMEWRSGAVAMPVFPLLADEMERARWLRRHIRFGMVLSDPNGDEWLNITQACDLAQAADADIGQSTMLFVRGQHSLPAEHMAGDYYVTMSAMMAQTENHVLTWNLRNLRAESIQSFSVTYGRGWQVIGELRPDVAQSIAALFGARVARVGLPVTLPAWRLSGLAMRVFELRNADATTPMAGLALTGHAIQRIKSSKHELHLDRHALDQLLTAHGDVFDESALQLLTGLTLRPGSKTAFDGRPVILYCAAPPRHAGEVRSALSNEAWLGGAGNTDKIVVILWCAP